MKKYLFLLLLPLLLCGCESSNVRDGRELYKMYLNKFSVAPEEIQIYNESYTEDGAKVTWKVDVGGVTRGNRRFRNTMEFNTVGRGMIYVERGLDYEKTYYNRSDLE